MADLTAAAGELRSEKRSNSQFAETWRRLQKNKTAMAALVVIFLLLLLAASADLIVSYDLAINQNADLELAKPSAEHLFGCDALGRDLFARIIHGTRISLLFGFGATIVTTIPSTLLGTSCAYYGGRYDNILMRFFDIIISIPSILLALAISAGFGNGITQLIVAMSIGRIASFTRVVRSASLNVVGQDYIEASRSIGQSSLTIIVRHVMPNVLGTILVQATMSVAQNILMGAILSFLGLGAPIPIPEWGKIMSEGLPYLRYTAHLVVYPTIFIAVTVLSINLFGDGLRDALDPRLKGKA